jgi:hypothetical protein
MLSSFMGNACSPKSAKSRCAVSRFFAQFSVSRYCVPRATWRSLKNGDVEHLVVALNGGDVTRLVLGGRLDALQLIGVFRRSSRAHFFPELLSVFGSEGWRGVQEQESTNTRGSRRRVESDHVRSKRVSGESDLFQLEPVEKCIESESVPAVEMLAGSPAALEPLPRSST